MTTLRKAPTVCLNMIVRNEHAVILRCLASLKSLIDHWVIVDTGSIDGTQDLIRNFFHDVPGALHERAWVNFGHNRTEALELAKGKADYLLILDADEVVQTETGFSWINLYHDSYLVEFSDHGISYERCQVVNNHLHWQYIGVLHEYIHSSQATTQEQLGGIKIIRYLDGARSANVDKFKNDAKVLEEALVTEPTNDRYMFYLAQSYRDAGNAEMAIHWYKKRIEMKRWDEEVWYSNYQVAQPMEKRGDPWDHVLPFYLRAFQVLPSRAEPLVRLMRYYMYNGQQYHIAALFGKKAMEIPMPKGGLFVENMTYEVTLPMEYAICAFYSGNDQAAISANNRILKKQQLPGDLYTRIVANRKFSLDRLYPVLQPATQPAPRIRVVVTFTDAGHFLDNCIETLLAQQDCIFEVIFLDNGSTDGGFERLPLDAPGMTGLRNESVEQETKCLHDLLMDRFAEDDICMILRGEDWLEHNRVLAGISNYFRQHSCDLLYTQFRFSDGRIGTSMPLVDPDELGSSSFVPLCCTFRMAAYHELVKKDSDLSFLKNGAGAWVEGSTAQLAIAVALVRNLGLQKSHFNDMITVSYNRERVLASTFPPLQEWPQKLQSAAAKSLTEAR